MRRRSQLSKRLVEFAAKRFPEGERQGFVDELNDHIDNYSDQGLSSRALWVGIAQLRPADLFASPNRLLGLGPISLVVGPVLIGRLSEDTWREVISAWLLMIGVLVGLVVSVRFMVLFFSRLFRSISTSSASISDRWVGNIRFLTAVMGTLVVFSTITVLIAMEHASWNAYLASDQVSMSDGPLPDSFRNGGWSGMGFVAVLAVLSVIFGLSWTARSTKNGSVSDYPSVTAGWFALDALLLMGLVTALTVAGSVPMFVLGGLSEMPGQAVVLPSVAASVAFLALPMAVGLACWAFATARLAGKPASSA